MAAQRDGFLREVDEALREDEFVSYLKRYGRQVGIAIIVGLLALAGYLWWDHQNKQAAAKQSEELVLALDKLSAGPTSAAAAAKDLEALGVDASPAIKADAALLRAGIAAQSGRLDEAGKLFSQVAADAAAPQPFRDLATIREIALRFDSLPPQQMVDRLKPLAIPGKAWFGSAGELLAMSYLKQGKPDQAGPLFAAMAKDKGVPESLRGRARLIAGQLGFDAGDNPSVAPAGGAAAAQP